jgi:hypothetical protein
MASFTVTINAYSNLPPSSIGDNTINLDYNETYVFTLNDFKNTIPAYSDPEGDEVETVKITSLPSIDLLLSAVPVILDQEITKADIDAGNLTYVADPGDTDGYSDSFDFDIADVGSSTYSGLTGTISINAGAQDNQPPSAVGDGSTTIDYGETLIFTAAIFTSGTTPAYADPEADAAAFVKILTLPALGVIKYNGTDVNENDVISIADINLGLLTYVPDLADTDGDIQGFTFAVADAGSGIFVS